MGYIHPAAKLYVPLEAALFLQPAGGEMTGTPLSFPLTGKSFPPTLAELGIWAFYLAGDELVSYLKATGDKAFPIIFETNGEFYQAELVPWLPGASQKDALESDFPQGCGVIPNQVGWAPGSASQGARRLIYDGLPVFDSLFIYMPEYRYINMDNNLEGVYPPGELVFSNGGSQVAVKVVKRLSIAQPNGSQTRLVNVPFFPIGMGEWWLYPPIFWESGDESLLVITTGSSKADWENFDVTPNTIFHVPVSGGDAQELRTFEGSPWSVAISPNGQLLAYYTAPSYSNDRTLHIAWIKDGETVNYVQDELTDFVSWAPDGQYIIYRIRSEDAGVYNCLENACGRPRPLLPGQEPIASAQWLDSGDFILESTTYDHAVESFEGVTRLFLAGPDR
jgi:hypothetical protein